MNLSEILDFLLRNIDLEYLTDDDLEYLNNIIHYNAKLKTDKITNEIVSGLLANH